MSDTAAKPFRYPIWTRGDLDGFFGLMVDNLVQVLMILLLCTVYVGMSVDFITTCILPGVAVSLLIGNLFYGLQAHYVARRDRNPNCTALPYGINTPSVFAFGLFVMAPIYRLYEPEMGAKAASILAWQAGMLACMVSGVIEFLSAFFAEKLRHATPRAALLGVLAAVGIAFIASDFAFQIYTRPLIGVFPLGILLLAYFARYRFPVRLPGGFIAVLVGALIAWGMSTPLYLNWFGGSPPQSFEGLRAAVDKVGWVTPIFRGGELLELVKRPELLLLFLTVSVPMGVINAIGSLQNIESAEAGGDRFNTGPSLAANGIGTIAAALFGSCFPTTIYIGHPAWKALGARSGYSILNGAFFTVCFLFGLGALLKELIPIEAGAAIVVYIGIIITAQAFQVTPRAHAPAVAFALFPALAALLVTKLPLLMGDAGAQLTLAEMVNGIGPATAEPTLPGMIALAGANSSWLMSTLLLTAMGASLIDRRYKAAAIWCGVAALLTVMGLLHAYRLEGNVIHEYFLWQKADAVVAAESPATSAPAALPDKTVLAAGDDGESAAASKHHAYRGFPIAIGYGLTALMLATVAIRAGRARPNHEPVSPPDIHGT